MDMPDLCSTAIMEAKKWLKEKKLTNSKSELDHRACTLNSIMVSPVSNSFQWSLSGGCVCLHTRILLNPHGFVIGFISKGLIPFRESILYISTFDFLHPGNVECHNRSKLT
jgi:hypothetical protein